MTLTLRLGATLVSWLALMSVLALLYMTLPPSPDQSQFDWMAFIATQGQPFYAGSFDMNWPGAMWLHELGIRLFGPQPWTWRLTDFLLLAGFTLGGAAFLRRANWPLAAVVFLFLYPPLYVAAGPWTAGQRDIIASGFLIIACYLALPGYWQELIAVTLAGACVAAAVLIRPTFLSFLFGVILLECLPLNLGHPRTRTRVQRAFGYAAGFSLGICAAVLAGLSLGFLDDWYQQSMEFAFSLYVGDPPQDWRVTLNTLFVQSWHWITLLALVGLGFWIWRDRAAHALVLALGVAATSAVSFAVQNKGFGYHLAGVLPVLVMFVAVALDGLNQARKAPGSAHMAMLALGVLVAASGLTIFGTAKKLTSFSESAGRILSGDLGPTDGFGLTEQERREIVAIIETESTPSDTMAVYGTNYELAYRARRRPTYRFFTPAADQINPGFVHFEAWIAEVETALQTQPPSFVVISRSALEGPLDRPEAANDNRIILARLVSHIASGYEVAYQTSHIVMYRKSP